MNNRTKAQEILKSNIVFDGFQGSAITEKYLKSLKSSGITGFFTSVADSHYTLRETMLNIRKLKIFTLKNEDYIILCTKVDDIFCAKQTNRIGVFLSFQDTYCLGYDVELMDLFYELGIRMVQLTANDANLVGDGCGEPRQAGLTRLGKLLIKKLNELGILVDLSHVGDQTRSEAIDISEKPCVVSHGNAMGCCQNPRNISDSVIKKLSSKGGVIGATTYPSLCTWKSSPTIDDFIDNVDYLVNLVGYNSVGLGLAQIEGVNLDEYLSQYPELYGPTTWPTGIESITAWPAIVEKLLDRGHLEPEVSKLIGGNFLRVMKEVIG